MTGTPGDNRLAYEQLMAKYRSSLEQECLAYQSLQAPDLSYADLVQEVAMRVWERITQFRALEQTGDEHFRNLRFEAWLRKTARSILNNLYRDRKTLKRNPENPVQSLDVAVEAAGKTSTPSSIAQRAEETSRVREALYKCLDDTLRTVVILHIHQNQSFPAIAERLGLTYDQVRHKYRTALKQMESELNP